jgi:hypothetical protein
MGKPVKFDGRLTELAYNYNRILIFGAAGVAIAMVFVILFIPVKTEIIFPTSISLQDIPGYGFQMVKISPTMNNIVHLNITLDGFEVKGADGEWTELHVPGSVIFNLWRDPEIRIVASFDGLESGSYTAVRFQLIAGREYSLASLNDGDVVPVDVPQFKVEFEAGFEVSEEVGGLTLVLSRGSGRIAEQMLPDYQITTGTIKIGVTVTSN